MTLLFKKLDKIISQRTKGECSLTISETLKHKKQGDVVIVGGIIKNIFNLLDSEPTIVVLDDGVGSLYLEVVPDILDKVDNKLRLGNIIIAKGYYSERKHTKKRPDGEKKFISVICSAITTVDNINQIAEEG